MATFPQALARFLRPGNTLAGPPAHDAITIQLQDEVAAVQETLGVNPQGEHVDVAARLANGEGLYPRMYGPGAPQSAAVPANQTSHLALQLQIPAQPRTSVVLAWGHIGFGIDVAAQVWQFSMTADGGLFASSAVTATSATGLYAADMHGSFQIPANTGSLIQLRLASVTAGGNLSFSGSYPNIVAHALVIPLAD